MASLRFTRKTSPVLIYCFIRDVFVPECKARSVRYKVYEDGVYDRIDFWKHLRRLPFSWHARPRAQRWYGKHYGCAADLNVYGTDEEAFFKNRIFAHLRAWGIAGRWEHDHAHIDAGGNEAFGDSSRHHTRGRNIGRPRFTARGNPIACDGDWGANTTRKLQKHLGVTVDGSFGPKSKRALQKRIGVTQDGQFGPKSVAALRKRVGTKRPIKPLGRAGGNQTMQVRLMLYRDKF